MHYKHESGVESNEVHLLVYCTEIYFKYLYLTYALFILEKFTQWHFEDKYSTFDFATLLGGNMG